VGNQSEFSVVGMVTRVWVGWYKVWVSAGLGNFPSSLMTTLAVGLTQAPMKWVPESVSRGMKCLGYEGDHLPPPSAEVNMSGAVPLHDMHRDSFTLPEDRLL
jgi:hypothetical protein